MLKEEERSIESSSWERKKNFVLTRERWWFSIKYIKYYINGKKGEFVFRSFQDMHFRHSDR